MKMIWDMKKMNKAWKIKLRGGTTSHAMFTLLRINFLYTPFRIITYMVLILAWNYLHYQKCTHATKNFIYLVTALPSSQNHAASEIKLKTSEEETPTRDTTLFKRHDADTSWHGLRPEKLPWENSSPVIAVHRRVHAALSILHEVLRSREPSCQT